MLKQLDEIARYIKRHIPLGTGQTFLFISHNPKHGHMLIQYLQHILNNKHVRLTRATQCSLEFSNGVLVCVGSRIQDMMDMRADTIILFDIGHLSDLLIDYAYNVKITQGYETAIIEVPLW